jgi:hypothetical protein
MSTIYAAKGRCTNPGEIYKDGACVSEIRYIKPCVMEDRVTKSKCSSLMVSEPVYSCKGKNDSLWGTTCRTPSRPIGSLAEAMSEASIPPPGFHGTDMRPPYAGKQSCTLPSARLVNGVCREEISYPPPCRGTATLDGSTNKCVEVSESVPIASCRVRSDIQHAGVCYPRWG